MSDLTRRRFLRAGAVGAAGLVLGFRLPAGGRGVFAGAEAAPGAAELNAWLRIAPDDEVTVVVGFSEMGQGIHTALAMLVAEELEVGWSRVRVETAPPSPAGSPYANPLYQTQATAGSTSVRTSFVPLRQAGAKAREMLRQAGAARFGVPAAECVARDGAISHPPTGRTARYGELAAEAARLPTPDELTLKTPEEWHLIGTSPPRPDGPPKVQGTAGFGIDVAVDGMLVGTVAACPVFGGRLRGVDPAPAEAVPGVRVVPLADAVVVVANGYWPALQGLKRLTPDWDLGTNADLDGEAYRRSLRDALGEPGAPVLPPDDVETALAGAARTVEAVYEAPFLAHAALEPLNATVSIGADGVDVWTGSQAQGNLQGPIGSLLGVEPGRVRVHTPYLGGGFGRRLGNDFVLQAAAAAKAVGRPVKLIWSREEDIRHDLYRPAAAARLRAGLDADGRVVAWEHHLAAPGYVSDWLPQCFIDASGGPARVAAAVAVEGAVRLGAAGIERLPYRFAAQRVTWVRRDVAVPLGFWRSIGPSYNTFFVEAMLDELARAASRDPVAFRLDLLTDQPRHRRVLQTAAEAAGWATPPPAGRFRGVALCDAFGSIAAQVAEVSIAEDPPGKKKLRVHRVTCAVDCGPVVHSDGAAAQVEGGVVFGLTAALYGAITVAGGRVQEDNFRSYKLLNAADTPAIEVHFVPSDAPIGGLGEIGTPPVAPAVANAVSAATGHPVRKLPIAL